MEEKKKKEELNSFPEIVEKIKYLQSLPEEIVIKFLKGKGSLASTDFKKRFSSNAQ